jgi:hypothetical protein
MIIYGLLVMHGKMARLSRAVCDYEWVDIFEHQGGEKGATVNELRMVLG